MSDQFVKDFEQNGLAVIPDFLTEDEMQAMKKEVDRLIAEANITPDPSMIEGSVEKNINHDKIKTKSIDKIKFFFEREAFDEQNRFKYTDLKSGLFSLANGVHCLNPVFKKITFSDKVAAVLKKLGYGEPRVVQGMYLFKNPAIGGEFIPHQDRWYLLLLEDNAKMVGFWFPLEDATVCLKQLAKGEDVLTPNLLHFNDNTRNRERYFSRRVRKIENGCLWYIPGSHKTGLHRKQITIKGSDGPKLEFTAPLPQYADKDFVAAPVKKGSCVLIDGLVVHKSAPNRSPYPRPAYTFHLFDGSNSTWDPECHFQPTKDNPFPNVYNYN